MQEKLVGFDNYIGRRLLPKYEEDVKKSPHGKGKIITRPDHYESNNIHINMYITFDDDFKLIDVSGDKCYSFDKGMYNRSSDVYDRNWSKKDIVYLKKYIEQITLSYDELPFYAFIESSNDCEKFYHCVINDEIELMNLLMEECKNCLSIYDMSLSEYENEYCCDFDDYKKLKRCKKHLPKKFDSFSFQLSDMCVDLVLFTKDLKEIEKYLDERGFDFDKPLTLANTDKIIMELYKYD